MTQEDELVAIDDMMNRVDSLLVDLDHLIPALTGVPWNPQQVKKMKNLRTQRLDSSEASKGFGKTFAMWRKGRQDHEQ